MEKYSRRYLKLTAFMLILLIGIMGYVSFINLVNFYVNDEVDYNEWSADLGNKLETDEATTFFEKFQFVNLNGAVRNILGQHEMNGILKLNNGHLISPQAQMTEEQILASANEVIKYANFCEDQGIPLLFVQPILKVDIDNKLLPTGAEDYSNENIDVFLSYLKSAEIDVLDIRECMKNDRMDMYDYTYATDHHWTSIGCFYSFTQISQWIETNMGVTANPLVTDIQNYDITTYSHWHLGSYGQRTGQYFAGIDDYELIIPSFDVSFINGDGTQQSFYDQVVNQEVFQRKDPKSRYTYDHALRTPAGTATTSQQLSLLLITDSYATEMAPYLKLAYSDYYYQYYPNGLNSSVVMQTNPDLVVLMPYMTSTFSGGAIYQ